METLIAASDWLAGTSLSMWMASTLWAVPFFQSIHILAICMVLASVVLLDLRLAGWAGRGQPLRALAKPYYPWIFGAAPVLLITGLLLVMAEPSRELLNWLFWSKMGLIIAAVLLTLPARAMLEDVPFGDLAAAKRGSLRVLAVTSLIVFVAIIVCGRWIAYAGWME